MSCYICEKKHIWYLVKFAEVLNRPPFGLEWRKFPGSLDYARAKMNETTPGAVAVMLYAANIKSVAERYEGRQETPEAIKILPISRNLFVKDPEIWTLADFAQAYKSIDCYEYQACDADDWNESEAKGFCDALRDYLSRAIPGYEEAEWGAPKG